ncbi:MAG: hypothetical protein HW390_803 [Candidatus Brocadiaceae bacterium]|nr:hypothetical protein [Candidatus Brocadiaceae bacterium]
MGNSVGGQRGLCVKLSDSWGGVDKPWLSVPAHRQYYLSELCRPYGAKTIGISYYPPLTQWATVVTPRWGVSV